MPTTAASTRPSNPSSAATARVWPVAPTTSTATALGWNSNPSLPVVGERGSKQVSESEVPAFHPRITVVLSSAYLGDSMKQPVERRLAAILAADVAGYSRLMGTD